MAEELVSLEERFRELWNRLRELGPGPPPFEQFRVTPSQFTLLDWVARHPGCGIQDVAAGLRLTAPTVSVAVHRLEEAGFLQRQPNPQDARSIRIYLNAMGEEVHRGVQEFFRRKTKRLLAGLTPEEREKLVDLLGRALSVAEEEDQRR